jgi:exonuclease VII small subunit
MSEKSESYEKNFLILEEITESLNKDEISIDDLMEKTKTALNAAKKCLKILNSQRGEFKKLEKEFSELLENSSDEKIDHDENEKKSSLKEDSTTEPF